MDRETMREGSLRDRESTRPALLLCEGDELSVVHADTESRRLLGTSSESIVGRRLVDIVHESGRDELGKRLAEGLGAEHRVCLDVTCTRDDGSPVEVRMLVHRIPSATGPCHVALLEALPGASPTAPALHPDDPSFVEFVGRLGHDVNNLLSTIIGSVGLLREESDARDTGQAQLLEDAYSAARECADLIEDLMASAGKQVLEPKAVDVNQVVNRIAELLERTVPEGIAVHVSLGRHLPPARVDPDRLETVLLNVALNAREAMPHGGNIRISTAARGNDEAPCVAVSIRDDGSGIPRALRERVLEPLFSTKPSGAGRGLGLSIANGFARQCGGALHIADAPGGGTTITITLPAIR